MTEPQIWAALGILAAALTVTITIGTQLMMRTIAAKFETVDVRFEKMDLKFEAMENRFDAKFDAMDLKFDAMRADIGDLRTSLDSFAARTERRLDGLDRDVHLLMNRLLPD